MNWLIYTGAVYQAYKYFMKKPKLTKIRLMFSIHHPDNWIQFCTRLSPHLESQEDMLSMFRITKQAKIELETPFDQLYFQNKVILIFNIYHYTGNLSWSISAFEKGMMDICDINCSVLKSNSDEHQVDFLA